MKAEGDIDFIKRAKEDPNAFEHLYGKYSEKVYRFLYFRVGYKHDVAEDLRQETFYKALQHIKEYHEEGTSYLTYLLKIAHNLLINYYRYTQRHLTVSLDDVLEAPDLASTNLEEETQQKIRIADLENALSYLDRAEQEILALRFQHQLSMKDIALRVGKTENAVKLTIMRAKKKLQNRTIFEVHHSEKR